MRRVVVTGLGMVTPIGNDVKSSWNAALEGRSGIGPITRFDASAFGCQIAGELKDFDPLQYMDAKEVRRFDLDIVYAIAAAQQAIDDSGLDLEKENRRRIGIAVGSAVGGLGNIADNVVTCMERGPRRVSPFFVPSAIINMCSGLISIRFGLQGPNISHVTACSTGLHSIGEAAWMIRRGDADVMVAGGSEGAIVPSGVAGFDSMHALSHRNDDPATASRPFDKDRDGFVMGEGAGVVVLEEYEHAVARGATIYAELVGYALTGDAHHLTMPSMEGPMYCMQDALERAGIRPEDIDYLNAHGTSTPAGDANETRAIKAAFGEHAKKMVVNSTKSMTGHLLGGAGGIESIFTILAVHNQISPPTINIKTPDEACDLDYCAEGARPMTIRYAMKNSFGFGGTNGTLIFKRMD
ncbi:MAG: beta-ketoacyl-ACP synthase II [Duodenibacillus sp.]|nr:beta-ketoacyl-ACP synthase II [Duodenibacillus sp.]